MTDLNMIGAATPSNYWTNSWAAQSLYSNDDNFMGIGPSYTDVNPYGMGAINPMSMNGSIYGMGGGYPMMGGMYGQNMDAYMQQMERMQNFQIDSQVRQQKKVSAAQFAVQSDDDAITRQIAILQSKIQNNEQDAVQGEYNKLVQLSKAKLGNGGYLTGVNSTQQANAIKAYAEKTYYATTGKSIIDDLRENGDGSFVNGMKRGMTFGLSNRNTVEENIAKITGSPIDETETVKKSLGKYVGGTVAWSGIGAAIGTGIGALLKAPKLGAKIGALLGAGTGITSAVATSAA